MIRLTPWEEHEDDIFITAEKISFVGRYNDKSPTVIQCDSKEVYVTESPEEVARKVLEYRLAMIRFGVNFQDGCALEDRMELLRLLTGLEEQEDE